MADAAAVPGYRPASRIFFGFFAGAVATFTFHQLALEALHVAGIASALPYNMQPVPPFGVPAVIQLAFWGGVWGIPLAFILPLSSRGPGYWIGGLLFGGVLPTVFAFYVIDPIRGLPMTSFPPPYPMIAVGPLVNAAWGLGTAVFLCLMP